MANATLRRPDFPFTAKGFRYFDAAHRHQHKREWFDAHKDDFAEHVEVPFTALVHAIGDRLGPLLPGIGFTPRKASKQLLRKKNEDTPAGRINIFAAFSEPSESMFESNPAIYLAVGAKPDDNLIGVGLYEPSARQMRELRPRFGTDHAELRKLLSAAAVKRYWGKPAGERYTRYPRDFDPEAAGAEYLWQKRWLLARHFTREEVLAPGFTPLVVKSLVAALPFLDWTRRAAGKYKRPKPGFEDLR